MSKKLLRYIKQERPCKLDPSIQDSYIFGNEEHNNEGKDETAGSYPSGQKIGWCKYEGHAPKWWTEIYNRKAVTNAVRQKALIENWGTQKDEECITSSWQDQPIHATTCLCHAPFVGINLDALHLCELDD